MIRSPANTEQNDKTNVTTKRSSSMNEFLLGFCSPRFRKVVHEKVIPILKVVAQETKNEIDDKVVQYLEELFKPEPKLLPETNPEPEK